MLLRRKADYSFDLERKQTDLSLKQYGKGDEISVADSEIWQVYRGVVQLSKIRQDGSEVVLGWVTADGTFSSHPDNLIYRAVALCDVYIKRYSFKDAMRNPPLAKQFIAQFSDRLIKSQQLLSIMAVRSVEERLKRLLLMLQQEMGQSIDGGVRLQVRFTHQHLAEAIDTTRVTVTRILGSLQERELIYFDNDRHIVIVSL